MHQLQIEYSVRGFPFRLTFVGDDERLLVQEADQHLLWVCEQLRAQPPQVVAPTQATSAALPKFTPAAVKALTYASHITPDPQHPGEIGVIDIRRWEVNKAFKGNGLVLDLFAYGRQYQKHPFTSLAEADWNDPVKVPAEWREQLKERAFGDTRARLVYVVSERRKSSGPPDYTPDAGDYYRDVLTLELYPEDGVLSPLISGNGSGTQARQSNGAPKDPPPATDPDTRPNWFNARGLLITALKNALKLAPLEVRSLLDDAWDAGRIGAGMTDTEIVAVMTQAPVGDDQDESAPAGFDWTRFRTVRMEVREKFRLDDDGAAVALLEAARLAGAFAAYEPLAVETFTDPKAVAALKAWQEAHS